MYTPCTPVVFNMWNATNYSFPVRMIWCILSDLILLFQLVYKYFIQFWQQLFWPWFFIPNFQICLIFFALGLAWIGSALVSCDEQLKKWRTHLLCMSVHLSLCPSVHLSVSPSVYPSTCSSVPLLYKRSYEANESYLNLPVNLQMTPTPWPLPHNPYPLTPTPWPWPMTHDQYKRLVRDL